MTFHLLTDAELAETSVTPDQLMAAVAIVVAMSDDDFETAARTTGRDPLRGMSSGRKARLRAKGLL